MAKIARLNEDQILIAVEDVPDDPPPVADPVMRIVPLSANTDLADYLWKFRYDWPAQTFLPYVVT